MWPRCHSIYVRCGGDAPSWVTTPREPRSRSESSTLGDVVGGSSVPLDALNQPDCCCNHRYMSRRNPTLGTVYYNVGTGLATLLRHAEATHFFQNRFEAGSTGAHPNASIRVIMDEGRRLCAMPENHQICTASRTHCVITVCHCITLSLSRVRRDAESRRGWCWTVLPPHTV